MRQTATDKQYQRTIRELSDCIVEAQRSLRILDAIKWGGDVQASFFKNGCRAQPPVDAAYYAARPLGFDPAAKRREFRDIERRIVRQIGTFSPVGRIMQRMCREYRLVVDMLVARGSDDFPALAQELYGSSGDAFHAGQPSLVDLGVQMSEALDHIDRSLVIQDEERNISGEQAVVILQKRLNTAFADTQNEVRVQVSDGIVADAAAGADYLKIRKEAWFNERDLHVLEVHEGWVHIGTTLNGSSQPVCTFLGKGPPSSTVTQEGLAVLLEVIAFASYPKRLRRLTNRVRAVSMAENGATFLDVFRFYREQGLELDESYQSATRVFRGSTPEKGPFTKDLCYTKGFVLIYNFLQVAVNKGRLDRIPLLFCGKTTLEDVGALAQLVEEGVVAPPRFLPPQFADLRALVAWMCYSSFFSQLNLQRIEDDFAGLL